MLRTLSTVFNLFWYQLTSGVAFLVICSLIYHPKLSAESDRYDYLPLIHAHPVNDLNQLTHFDILNINGIHRAQISIPPQNEYSELADWSCSQNSIARAMILTSGILPFDSHRAFINFAHTVPNAAGQYQDHRFDQQFTFNNRAITFSHALISMLYIPTLLQNILGYASVRMGMSPVWLAHYMNFYKANLALNDLHFKAVGTDRFDELIKTVQTSIMKGHAVVALVLYSSTMWHYLNIVGLNDSTGTVVIMDTDSRLYLWSYDQLKSFMNTGYQSDLLAPDEWLIYTLAAIANQITQIDYFNLLIVQNQAE